MMLQDYGIDQARIVLEVEIQLPSKKNNLKTHVFYFYIFRHIRKLKFLSLKWIRIMD